MSWRVHVAVPQQYSCPTTVALQFVAHELATFLSPPSLDMSAARDNHLLRERLECIECAVLGFQEVNFRWLDVPNHPRYVQFSTASVCSSAQQGM